MSSEEDNICEVERVVGCRTYKGKKQYFIKWVGFPTAENTWENVEDMQCDRLIKEFEERKRRREKRANINNSKESNAKESNAKESNAKESSTKESSTKESNAKESSTKESNAKESNAKESNAKESNAKESSTKKTTTPKESQKKATRSKNGSQKKTTASKERQKKATPKKTTTTSKDSTSSKDSTTVKDGTTTKQFPINIKEIQDKYNLPQIREVPNIYDSLVKEVEGIKKKGCRKIVSVKYIDDSKGEIDFEIAKIGLPLHLIDYFSSK